MNSLILYIYNKYRGYMSTNNYSNDKALIHLQVEAEKMQKYNDNTYNIARK